ncbi:non-ribosomal peptide synthetase [Anaerosporobacter faecicola]|uniref:non-ribosomal peptide synthetase n=1 Tax=Anaerosporobacter faecicola TaxID=2718714 RepID=UPI00143B8592|nr:non-ribosomal peptide synthetase [Anaerosporobacter faecicola]
MINEDNLSRCLLSASTKEKGITFIKEDGIDEYISYKQVYVRAKELLYSLRNRGISADNEVILQIDDHADFIYLFWACILGGIVPVPLHVGVNREQRNQLTQVFSTLKKPKIITSHKIYEELYMKECHGLSLPDRNNMMQETLLFEELIEELPIKQPSQHTIQVMDEAGKRSKATDLAYIQFSSGSTGNPKGIMISHKNVLTNIEAIIKRVQCEDSDSVLNWLPITHSFSLVVGHLAAIYRGINQYIMPTMVFLKNPAMWLEKANEYKNTMLISPNFGFHHFLQFMKKQSSYCWDLSCIKIIATGGEPIDPTLCKEFVTLLLPYSLSKDCIWPSYGMSEATVAITAPMMNDPLRVFHLDRNHVSCGDLVSEVPEENEKDGMTIVSVGYPYDACYVRICDMEDNILEEDHIGHIQIKGANITTGYYENQQANHETFTTDGWLRTGDLGFFHKKALCITGRAKEILFINGQNYYPMDLERLIKELPEVSNDDFVVCGAWNACKQKEEILVFACTKEPNAQFAKKATLIQTHLAHSTGLELPIVIPISEFPKASSGKIQRYKLVEAYQKGQFNQVLTLLQTISMKATTNPYKAAKTDMERQLKLIWEDILHMSNISIDQGFFELGGDSLKAAAVINQINQVLFLDLSLQDLFTYTTIEQLANYLSHLPRKDHDSRHSLIAAEPADYYPLSAAQKRLYTLHSLQEHDIAYHITQVIALKGQIKPARVRCCFEELIRRHEALRTHFVCIQGEVVQKIDKAGTISFTYLDAPIENLDAFIEDHIVPFDLSCAPLFRVLLIKTSDDLYYLVFDIHHIIADGISISILLKEFIQLYQGSILPSLAYTYKDYAVWQVKEQNSKRLQKQKIYWLQQLKSPVPVMALPYDHKRPSIQRFEGRTKQFVIQKSLCKQLMNYAKDTHTTLYMVLLSAFTLCLHKYTGQEELIIGTVTSGRTMEQVHSIVGMFVNTIALRSQLSMSKSVRDYVLQMKERSIEAFDHSDYQFEQLLDDLNLSRDLSRNPLFDVMFVMENMELPQTSCEEFSWETYDYLPLGTKLDLSMRVQERDGAIIGFLQYSSVLFEERTMERFIGYYLTTLTELLKHDTKPCSNLSIIPLEEQRKISSLFSHTKIIPRQAITVSQVFEQQVRKTPNRIAIVDDSQTLTYSALNEKANALARTLIQQGVKPNTIVALLMERTVDMAIGILGILKAGGAYLPIDPKYPTERINYLLENSAATTLVIGQGLNLVSIYTGTVLSIEQAIQNATDTSNPTPIATSTDLAYVIYTSGSTGKPKGVAIEHHSLLNYLTWFIDKAKITKRDKTILLSSYAFDLGYTSLYSALLSGGELHIVSQDMILDPECLLNYITTKKITYLKMTPSLFHMLVHAEHFQSSGIGDTLRYLVLGGETIQVTDLVTYHQLYPTTAIMNHYGPTECTIGCIATVIDLEHLQEYAEHPVIGYPIDNMQVMIVDEQKCPVGIGQTGELYISGPGLARGYLNREDLNQQRFLNLPAFQQESMRFYKTGDLGRFLDNGSIQFLGRVDNQIKVRGYRVELGEIEAILSTYPHVKKVAVLDLDDENGNKEICAYYESTEKLSAFDLRAFLATRLPAYMLPAYFVPVEEIPLTFNGKINRTALPKPTEKMVLDWKEDSPQTDTEKELSNIWCEILKLQHVGIHQNFFEIGGHSLRATVLRTKIHKQFHVELRIKDIFQHPTIKELSRCIEQQQTQTKTQTDLTIPCVAAQPYYPMSSAQKRIYVHSQLEPESLHYNMPAAFSIKGPLDLQRLQTSIEKIVNRHEIFRTTFHLIKGEYVQQIHPFSEVSLNMKQVWKQKECHNLSLDERRKAFIQPFSLDCFPLFRFQIIEEDKEQYILLLDMHHIIFDGVSIAIFIQELGTYYNGETLPPLTVQYKDYATWQLSRLTSKEGIKQKQFWLQVYEQEPSQQTLPLDYKRPATANYEGSSLHFQINASMTQALHAFNHKTKTTMFMLLYGAFSILLSKYSTQEDIIIGTAEAGRNHSALGNLIGVFINTLPIRTNPCGELTLSAYMEDIRRVCIEAFSNSEYPFDQLLDSLKTIHKMGQTPLFRTMFLLENVENAPINLQNLIIQPMKLEDTTSKFDLMLVAEEIDDHMTFTFKYATRLFKRSTIERMKESYLCILQAFINNSERTIAEIEYLPSSDKSLLQKTWNVPSCSFPTEKNIVTIFMEQVAKKPERIAVVCEGKQLTYGELNQKADCIAYLLRQKGVHKDSIVGILLDRSVDMILAILGILKAGAAYLPIDVSYPANRIQYMLVDSKAVTVLTYECFVNKLPFINDFICLERNELYQSKQKVEVIDIGPSDLAYVIYTSGTTGKPKGVMLEHHSVVNLVYALNEAIYQPYPEHLHIALLAPYIFDASVKQIFVSLLFGHTLHILPEEARMDGEILLRYYLEHGIQISDGTPIHLRILSECKREQLEQLPVQCFLIGGEALPSNVVTHFYKNCGERANDITIVNVYGPTECCVDATTYPITTRNQEEEVVIGQPLSNIKVYVMDSYQKLVPIGVPGELYLSGEGVARGYLNQRELTEEKFVENPFQKGTVMYRTGDRVQWTEAGTLRYLGRIDQQVKIRGFRIELGEIEKQLLRVQGVKDAVVIAREEGDCSYLCAYITSKEEIPTDTLRMQLSKDLPPYMIPSYFVRLEQMPITHNGKVDRKNLPIPDQSNTIVQEEIAATEDSLQETLVQVWQEVLGIPHIGINQNYYSLGGDSIKAIQISARLREKNLKVTIRDLLQHQTIKELSPYITPTARIADQNSIQGNVSLTPIQKSFFACQYAVKNHYNQSVMLYRKEGFDFQMVSVCFQKLLVHHDALRMHFMEEMGVILPADSLQEKLKLENFIQENSKQGNSKQNDSNQTHLEQDNEFFTLEWFDCMAETGTTIEEILLQKANALQRDLDIEKGPLIKLGLFHTNKGDHLLIVIHHLLIDGVSWRILLEDFATTYSMLLAGKEVALPVKTDSYLYWSEQLQRYAQSTQLLSQRTYWETVVKQGKYQFGFHVDDVNQNTMHKSAYLYANTDQPQLNQIDQNKMCPDPIDIESKKLVQKLTSYEITDRCLDPIHTKQLLYQTNLAYHTEINDILLAALVRTEKNIGRSGKLYLYLEGHGREAITEDMDVTRTIGWFTAKYPVFLDISQCTDLRSEIMSVKETLHRIPTKGIGYSVLRYHSLSEDKDQLKDLCPEPEICFNYLGQFEQPKEEGIFTISHYSTGDSISRDNKLPYTLAIGGSILGEKLQMTFTYDTARFDKDLIEHLANHYMENLIEIIKHCLTKQEYEYTPSDYDDDTLSVHELDDLNELLTEIEV